MESEIHRLVEQANEPKTTEVHSGGSPGGGGPGAMKNMAKKDLAWWRGQGGLLHICGGGAGQCVVQGEFVCVCKMGEVKVAQSCLTLCDSMDYTVHGILQARILKWVA